MNTLNKLWILLIDNILVCNQRKRHIKCHFFSVSSFCAVVKKAKSVSTVLSLPSDAPYYYVRDFYTLSDKVSDAKNDVLLKNLQ